MNNTFFKKPPKIAKNSQNNSNSSHKLKLPYDGI